MPAVGILGWRRCTAALHDGEFRVNKRLPSLTRPPSMRLARRVTPASLSQALSRHGVSAPWVHVGPLGTAIGGIVVVEAVRHPSDEPVVVVLTSCFM